MLLNYAFQSLKPQDINQWELILEVTDTVMTYRRRYRTRLHPTAILDLLLLDTETPRAIGYLAQRLEHLVQGLPVATVGRAEDSTPAVGVSDSCESSDVANR
jgi:uncharacterized alpha-E superfamily protein